MPTHAATYGSPSRACAAAALTQLAWIAGAAALGWTTTSVFAGLLALPRALFLVPYVGLTAGFVAAYALWNRVAVAALLRERLVPGLAGAVLAGAFAVWAVLLQRPSPAPEGVALVGSLLWLGVAYALVDASLISVLPVLATRRLFDALGVVRTPPARLLTGLASVLASGLVNFAYHVGYPELSARAAVGPLVGNTVLTLAYVVSGNPLAALLSHVALHVTAVLHAVDTAHQLPPHG